MKTNIDSRISDPAYVMTSRNNFHQQEYKYAFFPLSLSLISSVFIILWHILGATVEVVPRKLFSASPLTNN